jgi:hypothetical protein
MPLFTSIADFNHISLAWQSAGIDKNPTDALLWYH